MINDNEVDGGTIGQAPMPRTNNVEEIRVQALENVTLDADHITGEDHYASVDSRGDLTITNVDITESQITKDITLEMKDTQQNSDLSVYFNEKDLKAAPDVTVQDAEFFIQVADGNAQDTEQPIANIQFDLSFTQDGNTELFENLESIDGTYQGLVVALEQAFAERGLNGYTIEQGEQFTDFTTDSGQTFDLDYTGFFVNVLDDGGEPFTDIEFTPRQKSGTELAIILAQSDIRSETDTITNRVESTIILDGVGRGSNGGELVVGSTSNSASSTGIEVFNVTVEEDSVVHNISTTNDDGRLSWGGFQELNLTNGDVKGDFVLTNSQTYNGGPGFKTGLEEINATDFEGDIVLGRDSNIVNLGSLNAAVEGNVTYNATLNDGVMHSATTGAGDDLISVTLSNASSIAISTGNGTNTVILEEAIDADTTSATVTGGTGQDTIFGGAVSLTADTGAGNDTIYAENTGARAAFTIAALPTAADADNTGAADAVEFLFGRSIQVTLATDGNAASAGVNGYESQLVAIEKPADGYLTSQADLNAAIAKAINEDTNLSRIAEANVAADGSLVVSYLVDGAQDAAAIEVSFFGDDFSDLSTAVQNAMLQEWQAQWANSGLVMADLASAYNAGFGTDDGSESVASSHATVATVELTVGTTAAAAAGETETVFVGGESVSVTFTNPGTGATADSNAADIAAALTAAGFDAEVDGTTSSQVNIVTDEAVAITEEGTLAGASTAPGTPADLTGSDSDDTDNVNVINGGAGDDVIVLSSNTGADIVVYTGYNQGNDTIVHFETGQDQLNLSAYLINTLSPSGSEDSQVEFNLVAGTGTALQANSVNIIGFEGTGLNDDPNAAQFGALSAADFEAWLEDDNASTILTADLYQDNGVSIVMVQNDELDAANLGEYKLFEVSYANAAAAGGTGADAIDFTVQLIGTADFGADGSIVAGDVIA